MHLRFPPDSLYVKKVVRILLRAWRPVRHEAFIDAGHISDSMGQMRPFDAGRVEMRIEVRDC